jgi:hypothetical protein
MAVSPDLLLLAVKSSADVADRERFAAIGKTQEGSEDQVISRERMLFRC